MKLFNGRVSKPEARELGYIQSLRELEEQVVELTGALDVYKADAKLKAAANAKLEAQVEALAEQVIRTQDACVERDETIAKLREAASDYIEGKHFPDCKALRVDLKNPRCTCGHDALDALLEVEV